MTLITNIVTLIDRDLLLGILIAGLLVVNVVLNIRIDILNKRIDLLEQSHIHIIDVLTIYSNMFKEFRSLMEDMLEDLRDDCEQ